ncbi:hypothetical protein [Catellatospora tritici]|uniref:hypothetical protein n=1 Tax=Catellatospora tritici TaxID=2851566 RepID=UPI001C2D9FAF|nr:hypothetical protein [Catellatospora tritici]MBV1850214.1 hypothetical protein [Catellatospora tritici]
MTTTLPPVDAAVLAEALDALPARLRKRVDDAVAKAAAWPVSPTPDGCAVSPDEDTVVTLTAPDGVVRTADQAVCSCLLAPHCLHRTAVLALAPIHDGTPAPAFTTSDTPAADPPGSDPTRADTSAADAPGSDPTSADTSAADALASAPTPPVAARAPASASDALAPAADAAAAETASFGETARKKAKIPAVSPKLQPGSGARGGARAGVGVGEEGEAGPGGAGARLTERQRAAADGLWRAAVAVLEAGLSGSGVVLRSGLLRAVHECRAQGLHRAAAAGLRTANGMQAAAQAQPQFRLAELTDDLRELLTVTARLRDPDLPTDRLGPLLGTARRGYDPQQGLRLYGLCTVPVVADTGYAGTVTYLADRAGRLWLTADLFPGGATRAAAAADATVALGEAGVSHRELTRAGLIVSGGTATETGQLGAGRSVKAVRASGATWTEQPLRALWEQPLADQLRRAFAALTVPVVQRQVGADLLFVTVRLLGRDGGTVLAATAEGTVLRLTAADDEAALPFRENLTVLGGAPGVELLLVGRPDPAHQGHVAALAIGDPGGADSGLRLPPAWGGHADLGYDRLHRSHLAGSAADRLPPVRRAEATGDPALRLLRRHLERVVTGGRAVQALAESQERALLRARLDLGAHLLGELTGAARHRPRDTFGRVTGDDGHGFARAWLAAAVYEQAASATLTEASWLR